jgi:hypothetical protein
MQLHPRAAAHAIFEASRANRNRLFNLPGLAIDATAEKFKTTNAIAYTIDGVAYIKAATTALVFSAAHPVTQGKFGAFLVEISTANAVATKIGEATQTTIQSYATLAAAIAALPAVTAGKRKLGYITVNAKNNYATLSTNLTGAQNDLTFTAVNSGAAGNAVHIVYVDPAGNDAVLGVVVAGSVITVNLATSGIGAITSTAAQVRTAILASAPAALLVGVALKAANDGTGVVTALADTPLAGGTDTGWTALTDDLTDASDVTAATFVDQILATRSDYSDSWEEQSEALKQARTDEVAAYLFNRTLPTTVATYADTAIFLAILDALDNKIV